MLVEAARSVVRWDDDKVADGVHAPRAGRPRGGDAVAPGAHPGGRRPGRAGRARPVPGPGGRRGRRSLRRRARALRPTASGWSRSGPEGGLRRRRAPGLRRRTAPGGRARSSCVPRPRRLRWPPRWQGGAVFHPIWVTAESGDGQSLSDMVPGGASGNEGAGEHDGTRSTDVMSGNACERSGDRRGCRSTTWRRAPTRSSRRRCSARTNAVSAPSRCRDCSGSPSSTASRPTSSCPRVPTTSRSTSPSRSASRATGSPSTSCACTRSTTTTPR